MSCLSPTDPNLVLDRSGRPYFLWDMEMTVEVFRERIADPDPDVRAYFIAKLMRQAKPDDVFTFVSPAAVRALWPLIERHLGHTRAFWDWILGSWERMGHEQR